jgi:hypothetical protein
MKWIGKEGLIVMSFSTEHQDFLPIEWFISKNISTQDALKVIPKLLEDFEKN